VNSTDERNHPLRNAPALKGFGNLSIGIGQLCEASSLRLHVIDIILLRSEE